MTCKVEKIPIIVVSGFLGSGKTTLLRGILDQLPNTLVLVNEFGSIGLDHHLLDRREENTILLGGGCICCSLRQDLVDGLSHLLDRIQRGEICRVERVIVETTGLADPAPILHTVLSHPMLQHHYSISQVIVTVDAVNGSLQVERQQEFMNQIASADKIVLTKTDIAEWNQVNWLRTRLRLINPNAQWFEVNHGDIHADVLMGIRVGESKGEKLYVQPPSVYSPHVQPLQKDAVCSLSVAFDSGLDWQAFVLWLSMLLHAHGENMLRVKGMLDTGDTGPVVLNGVQHIIHPPLHLERWPEGKGQSNLVFIMRSIKPEAVLESLQSFQHVLGTSARKLELSIE